MQLTSTHITIIAYETLRAHFGIADNALYPPWDDLSNEIRDEYLHKTGLVFVTPDYSAANLKDEVFAAVVKGCREARRGDYFEQAVFEYAPADRKQENEQTIGKTGNN